MTPIERILSELKLAETKHPGWPKDFLHGTNILAEEAGEACGAAYDLVYSDGTVEDLKTELAHTGTVSIRMLIYLDSLNCMSSKKPGRPGRPRERQTQRIKSVYENQYYLFKKGRFL